MNLPTRIYAFMDKDEEGEYIVAQKSIDEITPPHAMIVGVYELKETYLLRKEDKDDKK